MNSSDPEDAWSINAVAVDVGVPAPGTDTGIDLELGVGNGQGSTPIQYTPPELKYGKSIQHLTYTNVGNLSLEDLNGTDSSWSSNVGDQYDLDRIVTLTVDDLPDDTEKVYVWAAIKYFNPLSEQTDHQTYVRGTVVTAGTTAAPFVGSWYDNDTVAMSTSTAVTGDTATITFEGVEWNNDDVNEDAYWSIEKVMVWGEVAVGSVPSTTTLFLGGSDQYYLKKSGSNLLIWEGDGTGASDHTVAASSVSDIWFSGTENEDVLVIDGSGGNPVPSGGLVFTSLDDDDAMTLKDLETGAPISFIAGAGAHNVVVDGGEVTFAKNLSRDAAGIDLYVTDKALLTLDSFQLLNSLEIDEGAIVCMTPSMWHTLKINDDPVIDGGRLDLTNNKLIVAGGTLGTFNTGAGLYSGVSGLIQSGLNDGDWLGDGIVTSMTDATTSSLTGLSVALSDDIDYDGGMFGGLSVASGDVLVMYSWGGDLNLDGYLNGNDYHAIDTNAPNSGTVFGFFRGDVNYDGLINGDDYFVIDGNFYYASMSDPFPV